MKNQKHIFFSLSFSFGHKTSKSAEYAELSVRRDSRFSHDAPHWLQLSHSRWINMFVFPSVGQCALLDRWIQQPRPCWIFQLYSEVNVILLGASVSEILIYGDRSSSTPSEGKI